MKTILVILSLLLVGCTSSTQFGPCVGVFDDKDPKLIYKLSANNLFWALFGFELIVPPVIVVANETFCPEGVRQ